MSQSEARPHLLTYFVRDPDGLRKIGPIEFESRGAAIRAKREARARYGERFTSPRIEDLQMSLEFPA